MGILQWLSKLLRKNEIKQIEAPKSIKSDAWKTELHYITNNDEVVGKLTQEQLRVEQIKEIEEFILYKSGNLRKQDIWKKITSKYEQNVLQDVDMQELIVLHKATKDEDECGDCNIRDFIEDSTNNIVKLVNKLIERHTEEAKKYNEIDINKSIEESKESINELIKEIEESKVAEADSEQEQIEIHYKRVIQNSRKMDFKNILKIPGGGN